MAKVNDEVWYCDDKNAKCRARVTRAATLVNGQPSPGSYDAATVDLDVTIHVGPKAHRRRLVKHVTGAKLASTPKDQTTPGRWWPRS